MLYQYYKYIIALFAAIVVASTGYLATYFTEGSDLSGVVQSGSFAPTLKLLYLSAIALAITTILFTHPFITDGDETLGMETPVRHACVQGNIVLISCMVLLQVIALQGHVPYFSNVIVLATAFILKIGLISLAASCIGFYAIKHRARVLRRRGSSTTAFSLKGSFRGL